jgi:hypothetical protein
MLNPHAYCAQHKAGKLGRCAIALGATESAFNAEEQAATFAFKVSP